MPRTDLRKVTAVAGIPEITEQRKYPRVAVIGMVRLILEDPASTELQGTLIDASHQGFRAVHKHTALLKGQIVLFRHEAASGRARVIWNRVTPDRVETGFLII